MAAKAYALRGELLSGNSFVCSSSFRVHLFFTLSCCILHFQRIHHFPRPTSTFEGQTSLTSVLKGLAEDPHGRQTMCFTG